MVRGVHARRGVTAALGLAIWVIAAGSARLRRPLRGHRSQRRVRPSATQFHPHVVGAFLDILEREENHAETTLQTQPV